MTVPQACTSHRTRCSPSSRRFETNKDYAEGTATNPGEAVDWTARRPITRHSPVLGIVGSLRPPSDRPGAAAVDGVRDGAELLAPDLSALLPERPNGELPARPCRRLRRVAGRSPCPPL